MGEARLAIGLAGLGVHGERYAAHLLAGDVPRARLSAVCRRDARLANEWARRHDVSAFPDVGSMIEDPRVDALVAVLPPSLHPVAVNAAFTAGKPVLVEKPLAASAAAARPLVESARGGAPQAMVAQTMRFDATVDALRQALPSLGAIHLLAINHRFEPSGRAWLDKRDEGGLLSNTGIHGVDLLRYLTGAEIVDARALSRRVVLESAADVFAAVLRLEPGGILATLDNSRATASRSGRIEAVGEHGQLIADHVHHSLVRVEGRRLQQIESGPAVPTVRETLRAFVDAVLDDRPVPIPLSEGLAAVEAVDMIRSSTMEKDQ